MHASKLASTLAREKWLIAITDGTVKLTDAQMAKITSIEEFCKLSIPPLFGKISLNTLKSRARFILTPEDGSDGWSYLKNLRLAAHLQTKDKPSIEPDDPPKKQKSRLEIEENNARKAQLEAHLTGMALSELLLKVHQFLTTSSTLSVSDRAILEKIVADTWCKFDTLISPISLDNHYGELSVISGGKP
ncbi:hypothetical protein [Pseudomonas syringae]|uniref:hypothetical protein n=1 Tax=Pseudomonas syringae TaxID=317 RepID=UPI000A237649|nr:hypothetical protein [Pseudomonas syringae]MBL3606637.1 hypothetical protein [Pseudomonas syringae pv. actinidiae]OSR78031.1 hypothetical protein BV327_01160 [Pseudomonas syringae pv. actinidiae]OSS32665.1 hypothetical protein BV337_00500 [Pseudomonas syringae pv. actinidiae]